MMTTEKEALKQLTARLKEQGFAGIRFYVEQTEHFSVGVFEGKQERSVQARESIYFVEAGKDGKRCCTYFNTLDDLDEVAEQLTLSAMASQEDYTPIPAFKEETEYTTPFCRADEREIANLLCRAEQAAREEKKIACVDGCSFSQTLREVTLMDENGTCMKDSGESMSVNVSVVSREDGDTEIAWGTRSAAKVEDLQAVSLAKEVAQMGAQRLHASPIASGKYPVILKNDAAAELLEAYLPIFFASEIQNEMSRLAGKLGQQIAVEDLDLLEDPNLPQGRVHRHFDDEGVAVSRKYLIHKGKLESVLYNRKTAQKDNTVSSGNGFKAEVTSSVGTGVTNVVLQSESGVQYSMEQLCEKMENGLIVTGLEGVFAGANSITGSFSLLCKGLMVENGKVTKPFCEVTVAGSIYDLMQGIIAFGDDPAPTAAGSAFVQTPSILLKDLAVSGL